MSVKVESFEPHIDNSHKFAVAIPVEGGSFMIIETYEDLEWLEVGLNRWRQFANERGITQPYPLEILDEKLKCQIIPELLHRDDDSQKNTQTGSN